MLLMKHQAIDEVAWCDIFPSDFFPSPFGLFFSGPEQVLVNDVMPIFHCSNNIFQLIIDLRIHHNDETDGYLQNVFVLADFLHL